jgi:hypothetical protein
MAMADKTVLAVPGRKAPMPVPRILKRILQIVLAVVLTSAAMLVLMAGNGMLQTKTPADKMIGVWYSFVIRPDILATMVLTAMVTIAVVYWMRDNERGG